MRRYSALGFTLLGLTMAALTSLAACGGNSNSDNNGSHGSTIGYRRQSVSPIGLGLKNLMVLYVPANQPTPPGTETINNVNYYAGFTLGSGQTASAASATQTPSPDENAAGSLYLYGQNANGCGTPCTFNIMLGLAYQQQSPISPNIIAAYVPSSPTVAPPAPKYYSSEAVYLGTGMNYMWNGPASPPNPIQPNTGDLYIYMQCPGGAPSCQPSAPGGHRATPRQRKAQ